MSFRDKLVDGKEAQPHSMLVSVYLSWNANNHGNRLQDGCWVHGVGGRDKLQSSCPGPEAKGLAGTVRSVEG
jgi:hypothetical protein